MLGFRLCGAGVNIRSNMFLPFGKVRMGLSLGRVILWVGQDEFEFRMGYPLGRLGWVLV